MNKVIIFGVLMLRRQACWMAQRSLNCLLIQRENHDLTALTVIGIPYKYSSITNELLIVSGIVKQEEQFQKINSTENKIVLSTLCLPSLQAFQLLSPCWIVFSMMRTLWLASCQEWRKTIGQLCEKKASVCAPYCWTSPFAEWLH